MPLVLEGLVSTLAADGGPHLAPMGPHVPAAEFDRFTLRPFPTSQTYRNLLAHGEGVLHVTDDVLLLAKAAVGPVDPPAGLFRLQPGQARRPRGGHLRDPHRDPAARRDRGRVSPAGRDRREDRRGGRARGHGAVAGPPGEVGMTRVTTGSRLHFGLLRPPPAGGGRGFGGCGLMVEAPAVRVAVGPARDWSAAGPLADRALAVARR